MLDVHAIHGQANDDDLAAALGRIAATLPNDPGALLLVRLAMTEDGRQSLRKARHDFQAVITTLGIIVQQMEAGLIQQGAHHDRKTAQLKKHLDCLKDLKARLFDPIYAHPSLDDKS